MRHQACSPVFQEDGRRRPDHHYDGSQLPRPHPGYACRHGTARKAGSFPAFAGWLPACAYERLERASSGGLQQLGRCLRCYDRTRAGRSGRISLDPDTLYDVAQFCRKNGLLLIVDEVIDGIFRCGEFPSLPESGHYTRHHHHGQGHRFWLPHGACAARIEVAEAFEPGDHVLPSAAATWLWPLLTQRSQRFRAAITTTA